MVSKSKSIVAPARPAAKKAALQRAPAAKRPVTDDHRMTSTIKKTPAKLASAFQQIVQRELSQRADAGDVPSPEALLWSAAHASRELLADRWAVTQAADRANKTARRVH
mgnify:FL=1